MLLCYHFHDNVSWSIAKGLPNKGKIPVKRQRSNTLLVWYPQSFGAKMETLLSLQCYNIRQK